MKQYSKVKVLRFEGYGAEKKCQDAVNQGIDRGWQPINMNSFISTHTDNLVVLAFMGKLKETDKEEIEYQEVEGEPEKEEIGATGKDVREERVEPEGKTSRGTERQERKESSKEEGESYEKCPRCGNISLEIREDHSAVCQYCGHLIDDIREGSGKRQEEEPGGKPTF